MHGDEVGPGGEGTLDLELGKGGGDSGEDVTPAKHGLADGHEIRDGVVAITDELVGQLKLCQERFEILYKDIEKKTWRMKKGSALRRKVEEFIESRNHDKNKTCADTDRESKTYFVEIIRDQCLISQRLLSAFPITTRPPFAHLCPLPSASSVLSH